MKIDTSKSYTGDEVARLVMDAEQRIAESVMPFGRYHAKVTRADGSVEEKVIKNIVISEGLNRLASRAVSSITAALFHFIGVGTQTAAHSLGSDQPGFGEVSRKTSINTGSGAQSREYIFLTQTWAGFTDTLTGIVLDTVFTSDGVSSHATTGAYLNAANGLAVTLAASDFLLLTAQIRVGSHNLAHSQ